MGWRTPARAAVAAEAYQTLLQGRIVAIAGDEQNVANGTPAIIGDRLHRLSPGFAELAAATGAAVLPIYSELRPGGCIQITILPPLTWDAGRSHSEQVEQILRAYCGTLAEIWCQAPAVVVWEIMQRHLQLPRAEINAPLSQA